MRSPDFAWRSCARWLPRASKNRNALAFEIVGPPLRNRPAGRAAWCNCTAVAPAARVRRKRRAQGFWRSRPETSGGLQWRTTPGSPISQHKDRSFPNEQERAIRWRAEKAGAGGGESNEECPCAIFQVPRGVGNSAHEREDLFRLQC